MNANELYRLLLALALTPAVFLLGRRIRIPGARVPFLVGYLSMLAAFVTSLDTDFALLGLRILRHLCYAAGGCGLAVAAWRARRYVVARREVG
ncbi:MAG TPA: hypothetical protein VF902_01145 [Coriobacteriia bacterium]